MFPAVRGPIAGTCVFCACAADDCRVPDGCRECPTHADVLVAAPPVIGQIFYSAVRCAHLGDAQVEMWMAHRINGRKCEHIHYLVCYGEPARPGGVLLSIGEDNTILTRVVEPCAGMCPNGLFDGYVADMLDGRLPRRKSFYAFELDIERVQTVFHLAGI